MEIPVRARRRRRWLRRLLGVLGWATGLGVLAAALPTPFGPPYLGVTVVSGESMLPTYRSGDVVVTWRTGSYPAGTPIVYRGPSGEAGEGMNVVHRVVRVEPNGDIVAQGDNNDHVDPWLPRASDVRGEVVLHVPDGGMFLRWLGSPLVLALIAGMLVAAAVFVSRRERPPPTAEFGVVLLVLGTLAAPASAASLGPVVSADVFATSLPAALAANPVSYEQTLTSETATQYCAVVTVTNHGTESVDWEITLDISAQPYNAIALASSYNVDTVSFRTDLWRVRGVGWNRVLAPGASYEWGYCGTRAPEPLTDQTATLVVTSTSGGQYCADVTVTTTSAQWVRWRATIDHDTPGVPGQAYWLDAAPTNTWNVTPVSYAGGAWVVRGVESNEMIRAGTPATFGFCAPVNQSASLVPAIVSIVTNPSGGGHYCAAVTVSTTSPVPVVWSATLAVPVLPTNSWNVETVSYAAGTWVVRGVGWNDLISAGSQQ